MPQLATYKFYTRRPGNSSINNNNAHVLFFLGSQLTCFSVPQHKERDLGRHLLHRARRKLGTSMSAAQPQKAAHQQIKAAAGFVAS